jgi:hypothetical protein
MIKQLHPIVPSLAYPTCWVLFPFCFFISAARELALVSGDLFA